MTAREKLQLAYELAFYPPCLHVVWNRIKKGEGKEDGAELSELVDMALTLHQALPEEGYASQRALKRLAVYQANARAFGTVQCLRTMRHRLGRKEDLVGAAVPGGMVRDIGLPPFCRSGKREERGRTSALQRS